MSELRPHAGGQGGPTLGRYHLAEAIGGGPTGEVFRAKVYGVAGFERQFAVKRFYKAICTDPARLAVLADSARKYQTIEHPRIARLHEYGVIDGQAFVAVELVPGVDLGRFIAFTHGLGAPVPPGAALGMIAQLARALAYAQGRSVLHLGLCPTNVVCTPDGDVKVMDFGLLRARLPERPGEDPSLAARLPYLAPEQLREGLVTPATDVFQLASVAHELLTGKRAFSGGSVQEIAQRLATGQVSPELLPAGIADVLERAHAARPEDRWSNAAAFADYIDAAIRKAPQSGGRSDVAAAVRKAMQRSIEMEAEQMSGAVSFPLPSPPPSLQGLAPVVPVRESGTGEEAATRVGEDSAGMAKTMMGVAAPRAASVLPRAVSEVSGRVPPMPPMPPAEPSLMPLPAPEETFPGGPLARAGSQIPSVPDLPALELQDDEVATGIHEQTSANPNPTGASPIMSTSAPPLPAPPEETSTALLAEDPATTFRPRAAGGSGVGRALMIIGVLVVLGGGGYFAYTQLAAKAAPAQPGGREKIASKGGGKPDAGAKVVAKGSPVDAGSAIAPPPGGAADAGGKVVAAGPPDAGAAIAPPPGADDKLRFESTPAGALVYIDGAMKGKTPLDLPASGDRHKVALILPGHKLYRGEVDGAGVQQIKLDEVAKTTGDGKIKVRCHTPRRLYIIVDGVDSGEICPSERIYTRLGEVTIELYDPVSDTTSTHKVNVGKSSGSQRVRLDD